ncbi:hypothetical protein LPB137_02525 [Poseidonibacter parvus]|uniref:NarX-like N-terminal domain-containing protein n=1 Tax=Poseidonibacter parvus TaxID=1850254 RepID=A0A1P8KJS5_9BACT|nr:type IV pili methyl-accepting chemotaxis transducer N-terminal domain-containing protein [Poseidonibacter parvus]APW64800.1 hypothetical protein LPB137_02525 [Poseidonibacter parvus]
MKTNTISRKIKLLGILFILLMLSIINTTIYLSEKNKKDALIINLAGKERMLTQKISKNIFYTYHNKHYSFNELDMATIEFIYNLNSLKDGNTLIGIEKSPTEVISNQISKIQKLWDDFYLEINNFKKYTMDKQTNNEQKIKDIINTIHNTNNILLNEVDSLVTLYTLHAEEKTDFIRYIQYLFFLFSILLIIYSFIQLRKMESNAKKFLQYSKELVQTSDVSELKPMKIEAEKEIVEASDTINCFINKINSAVNYSQEAIEQSQNASVQLEEITDEFDKIIDELKHSGDLSTYLDKSEDMVIQSHEDLIKSTEKLNNLKDQLNTLLQACKPKKDQ